MKKSLYCLAALPLLAFASGASAQTTCQDVTLSYEITANYPDAAMACREVVERDGSMYVKMKARLTRQPSGNHATFVFLHADGTEGPQYSATLDPSWRANIAGRDYRLRDLARGQELSVYLPSDRWAIHVEADDVMDDLVTPVAITAAEPEPMLPSTAGNMPLFALFGALALIGAGMIRLTRRQAS